MTPLRVLSALVREARRLLTAALCRWDVHDLPPGYHRVGPDECEPGRPIWDVPCRGCAVLFAVQTDVPHPELENRVARGMARHRAANDLRAPRGADRRPS